SLMRDLFPHFQVNCSFNLCNSALLLTPVQENFIKKKKKHNPGRKSKRVKVCVTVQIVDQWSSPIMACPTLSLHCHF
uniref:Uncharacterized protein n=1 Tax=Takifugu rubripes TaxID=31033 RepID=A0A674MG66_TAKRU